MERIRADFYDCETLLLFSTKNQIKNTYLAIFNLAHMFRKVISYFVSGVNPSTMRITSHQSRFYFQTLPTRRAIKFVALLFLLFHTTQLLATNPTPDLQLTDKERQWLETHPKVSFTGDPNWLPYEAFNSKGEYIGIVSEHLALIAQITGIEFRISPSETWTESTEKAKNGLVDILSETDDSDLASHLNFTNSYLSNPIVIAMQDKENYVESINSIKDRRIGVIKDYGYVSKILRTYPDHNFVIVDDIQDGLVSVSTGEVDALLCTLALCSYTIAELGLNNVKITGKTEFDTKLALGVQKHFPELLSILNKAIEKISPEQKQEILDGWIKQKFVEKTDYSLVYQVILIAFILLGIFIFWNRRLSQEINLRKSIEKELKSAEEVLRLSQQRLLLHFEQTPLGVVEWNTDFECMNWNPAAERIFGFTKEEMMHQHATTRILPDSKREAVDKIWNALLENRGGTRSTIENLTKDGRIIMCEWYNTPLVGPDGKVIGVASLVEDVTDRKKAEQELEHHQNHLEAMVSERTAALEMANKELEAFSYSVSHDLRAPLRSIDGFSHALLEDHIDALDETGEDYLQRIRSSAQRMGKLIDAMLSLSRVTRSKLNPEIVDLSAMAQAATHKLRDHDPKRKIDIDIAPGIRCFADRALIGNVLDNLLGNAWKYTSKSNNARIEFSTTVKDNKTVYFVRDNGAGFEMKYANKLFGAFQRLHRPSEFEGTGIGLVTVARIIRRHGGDVWADAEIGEGAAFYFTLGEELSSKGNINNPDSIKQNPA